MYSSYIDYLTKNIDGMSSKFVFKRAYRKDCSVPIKTYCDCHIVHTQVVEFSKRGKDYNDFYAIGYAGVGMIVVWHVSGYYIEYNGIVKDDKECKEGNVLVRAKCSKPLFGSKDITLEILFAKIEGSMIVQDRLSRHFGADYVNNLCEFYEDSFVGVEEDDEFNKMFTVDEKVRFNDNIEKYYIKNTQCTYEPVQFSRDESYWWMIQNAVVLMLHHKHNIWLRLDKAYDNKVRSMDTGCVVKISKYDMGFRMGASNVIPNTD